MIQNSIWPRDVFDFLVYHHCTSNLAGCLPHCKDGEIKPPTNKYSPIRETLENQEYSGILLLKNGDTLLNRLIKDKYISKRVIDVPITVNEPEQFFEFLSTRTDQDGVFVLESEQKKIYRIARVKNDDCSIEGKIPLNFLRYDGIPSSESEDPWLYIERNLGTKTRLAMELTQAFPDIEAYQIKRSAYTKLGMGKVTEFGSEGLKREFFLKHEPGRQNIEEHIVPEMEISGYTRNYETINGSVFQIGPDVLTNFGNLNYEIFYKKRQAHSENEKHINPNPPQLAYSFGSG